MPPEGDVVCVAESDAYGHKSRVRYSWFKGI